MPSSSKIKTIVVAGLLAGTLDIVGAIVVYVSILKLTTAQKVLQSVAAGIYGKDAYSGGIQTAAAGLIFHFFIAMIFAAVYVLIFPYFNKLIKSTFIKGFIFGCVVWLVMNYLVVPISNAASKTAFRLEFFLYSIGLIIFCVGVPIAWVERKSV